MSLFGARSDPRTTALPVEGHIPGFNGDRLAEFVASPPRRRCVLDTRLDTMHASGRFVGVRSGRYKLPVFRRIEARTALESQRPRWCGALTRCRRRDSNPRHADYDSARFGSTIGKSRLVGRAAGHKRTPAIRRSACPRGVAARLGLVDQQGDRVVALTRACRAPAEDDRWRRIRPAAPGADVEPEHFVAGRRRPWCLPRA